VIEVTAITHRKDPILQGAPSDVTRSRAAVRTGRRSGEIVQTLRDKGFAVEDLALSAASGRTHVVLSLRKRRDSDAKQVLHFLLAGVSYIKHAVIVDSDVNVRDPADIEWGIATRVQGDADLVVIPNLRARSIDPSKKEGMFTAKVGIDATVPIAERRRFKRISVPAGVNQSVTKRFATVMTPKTNVS
jgi:2,5-furandicarboxylate decarboxylase 1